MPRSVAALLGLATLLALNPGTAPADEVTDQLEEAKRLYEAGDIAGALSELEFATQAIRGRVGEAMLAAFPAAPRGWQIAEDGGGKAAAVPFLGGSTVERSYVQEGGQGRMSAQIVSGGGFLQGLAQMMSNPQLLAAQPNAKRVRIGREAGVLTFDTAQRSGQLVIDLGGKASVMIEGSDLAGPEPLLELAKGFDLKKVKELVGI